MERAAASSRGPQSARIVLLSLLTLVAPGLSGSARGEIDFRISPAFFSGDFGSDIGTDVAYLPFTMRVRTARQEFRATLSFLSIHTDEPVTFIGGEIIPGGPGGSTSQTGPGDLVLRDDFFFLQGTRRSPWVYGSLRAKLPIADENKGLGTGEFDYGAGVGIIQPLDGRWSLLVEALYVVRGDPPGIDYENTWWALIGTQAQLSERMRWNLYYESRESVIQGRTTIRDLSTGISRRVSDALSWRADLFIGLSDTAEDYGLSLGFTIRRSPWP
ncbi:MAG: hypothetical protein O7A63_06870 [Acidobacteria bacterium]|nr:hypothetical protein [Acidobacteriota bacterium]